MTLSRLGLYVKCLENKAISDGQGIEPTIVKENISTALVDGNNILGKLSAIELFKDHVYIFIWHEIVFDVLFLKKKGPAIGKFAMDLAMKKAKHSGIGLVSVRGITGYGQVWLFIYIVN